MDAITAIVTAFALGAASGLKDKVAKVITEAYSALKTVIQNRYNKVKLFQLFGSDFAKSHAEKG
jgi:hypothetical protein